MNLNAKVVLYVSGMLSASFLFLGVEKVAEFHKNELLYKQNLQEFHYLKEATLLTECLYQEGTPVSTKTIKETLQQIDRVLPKYFPDGPYTREDFIAMAWLESQFNKYEIGTHGEKGVFQIMPDEFAECKVATKNRYEIGVNTEICMHVLRGKYTKFPDYKKAIIAYNGVVITKSGKWSEKYWKSFERRRAIVESLLNSDATS